MNDIVKDIQIMLLKKRKIDFEIYLPDSTVAAFKIGVAERLQKAYFNYLANPNSKNDFLISLRNYLLYFQESVLLPQNITVDSNEYGLMEDADGKFYAISDLPEYTNEKLIEDVFLRNYIPEKYDDSYLLYVNPQIKRITGFEKYKSIEQKLAVTGALNTPEGYTSLIALPTGGGKSLISQTLSYLNENGLTIVIVPTTSLSIDQERVAKNNIKIHNTGEIKCYYSDLPDEEKVEIINNLKAQKLRLLFISPEALIKNPVFKNEIDNANATGYLKNIIIDEAHIVIEWGNFFRVDYQCLEAWRKMLYVNNKRLRTILLSATYDKPTVEQLKSMFSSDGKFIEIRCDSLRKEPRFTLVKAKSKSDKTAKIIELIKKLPRPMILYVLSPDDAENILRIVRANGITNAVTFTGKTSGSERKKIIEKWSNNDYELIIATSAFGVGVDKPDVRTVLHTYIPENPNKYYQELGRGGRDGLPCLSIMCIHPEEDLDSAFNMLKKVLTTEKIIGRWESMFNSKTTSWFQNTQMLDTSVKPNYHTGEDYAEDASKVDVQWNIYVILLLRRYNMIEILDMVVDNQKYYIRVQIINDRLYSIDDQLVGLINTIHDLEWSNTERGFRQIRKAVQTGDKACWSEMFYRTYSYVDEYCAGCDNHINKISDGANRFKLVKKIDKPIKNIPVGINNLFGRTQDGVLILNELDKLNVIISKGFNVVVFPDDIDDNPLKYITTEQDINIMGEKEFFKLMDTESNYYISGGILYVHENDNNILQKLNKLNKFSRKHPIKVLHVFKENIMLKSLEKDILSYIDGPQLYITDIERI